MLKMKIYLLIILIAITQTISAQNNDCTTRLLVCDKNTLSLQAALSEGADPTELNNATCFNNGGPSNNYETNSTWLYWNCTAAGSFTFVATPTDPSHDLDFVVFRMINSTCNSMEIVRCMATGSPIIQSPCYGPTGLLLGDTDLNGSVGCGSSLNNYLAPLDMQVGETYAVCITNFTTVGAFSLSFGGTAQINCNPTSTQDVNKQLITIYPNPVSDVLHIETTFAYSHMDLVPVTGGHSYQFSYQQTGDYQVNTLPSGAYLLVLEDQKTKTKIRKPVILVGQ
jgi:Secretion system C-terminal sorting domain